MDVSECRTNPASPAPHTRQAIADEITRYSSYLIDLKSRLNRLAPISELPAEILSEVFLYAAAVDGSDAYSSVWPTWTLYGWICVSHVCKYWRFVALSCPALWCNLTVTRREWTTELLARSKKVPLYVTMTYPVEDVPAFGSSRPLVHEESEETAALVLSHLARIRSLSVTVKRPLPDRTLQLLDGPVSLLESLTIQYGYAPHTSSAEHHHTQSLVHRAGAHRLRRLEVHNLHLQWNQFLLAQLTHLTITGVVQQRYKALVDAPNMLDALSQMSLLEELVIETSLAAPFDQTVVPTASTRASLPHLRHLRVRETPSNCACLLMYLETPSLSRLSLQLEGDTTPFGAALLTAVATKMASLGTFLTLRADFSGHWSDCVHLKAYQTDIDHHAMRDTASVLEKYTPDFEIRFNRMDLVIMIIDICRLFPIRDIRNLFIAARWFPLAAWRTLLHSTGKVTELFVINSASCNWLSEVLLERCLGEPKEPGESHFYHYVLPRLRRLTLIECFFSEQGYNELIPGVLISRLVDGLLDCFMDRYECGAEIEQLRIVQPVNVDREEIDLLNEVVRDVDWDGTVDYQRNTTNIDDYRWENGVDLLTDPDLFGTHFIPAFGDEEGMAFHVI
ncbi:uncharacterized protein B0H18DRAFT_1206904 [Fomitopsis serialis]|uniref:uncharacterized protein n=1 Tax=Fomitopsis serialis TaxID=139415 RepID=UPI00200816C4|nr:uncharacterized protein B0H18DRAFT_1206904 [Neoantrodia serialis]KAH9936656.1 hypothetical protein B0H18DRAFT_1206904 [Neoantrodia serialis]